MFGLSPTLTVLVAAAIVAIALFVAKQFFGFSLPALSGFFQTAAKIYQGAVRPRPPPRLNIFGQ